MTYQPPTYNPDDELQPFEALPPGRYVAVVEAMEVAYGQASGEPYVKWTFTIAEGDCEGRKCWNNTTLQEGKAFGFYGSMKAAVGEDETATINAGTYGDVDDFVMAAADAACGRMVELAIGNRLYQGKKQTDVQGVKEYGGQQLSRVPAAADERPAAKAPARKAPASPAQAKRGKSDDMGF